MSLQWDLKLLLFICALPQSTKQSSGYPTALCEVSWEKHARLIFFFKQAWKGNRTVIISVGFTPFELKMSSQTSRHKKPFALCLANLTRWPDFVLNLYYSVLSQVLKTWNAAAVLDLIELFVNCKTGPKHTRNTCF